MWTYSLSLGTTIRATTHRRDVYLLGLRVLALVFETDHARADVFDLCIARRRRELEEDNVSDGHGVVIVVSSSDDSPALELKTVALGVCLRFCS